MFLMNRGAIRADQADRMGKIGTFADIAGAMASVNKGHPKIIRRHSFLLPQTYEPMRMIRHAHLKALDTGREATSVTKVGPRVFGENCHLLVVVQLPE
jgi:hypothetical protein